MSQGTVSPASSVKTSIEAETDGNVQSRNRIHSRPTLAIRALAELFGTFFIVFVLLSSSTWDSVAANDLGAVQAAISTFIAYAAVSALFARISGAHFNPGVTIASALVGGTKLVDAVVYIVVQVIGGFGAALMVFAFLPTMTGFKLENWVAGAAQGFGSASSRTDSMGYLTSQISQDGGSMSFSLAAAVIVQVISAVIAIGVVIAHSRRDGTAKKSLPIFAGIAYTAGILITWPITGDGNNPARTTGFALAAVINKINGSFTSYFGSGKASIQDLGTVQVQQLWLYWLAPIIAAAIVAVAVIIVRMTKNYEVASDDEFGEFDEDDDDEHDPITPASASGNPLVTLDYDETEAESDATAAGSESSPQSAGSETTNSETSGSEAISDEESKE